MNKRLTIQNSLGKTVYCILSSETDYNTQLETVFGFRKGGGFCVEWREKTVKIIDYFHADTVATLEVLALDDTEEAPLYQWTPVDETDKKA